MSRAFVKDQDEGGDEALPERPISSNPNFVTPRGLAQMDEHIEALRKDLAHGQQAKDRALIALASRDLRYWAQRRATAQRVEPPSKPDKVGFGTKVTIARADGRRQSFAIVGEDEADPSQGLIAYTAPLARALLGKAVGEEASGPGGEVEIIGLEAC